MSVDLSDEGNKEIQIDDGKDDVGTAQPRYVADSTRRDAKQPGRWLQYSDTEEVEARRGRQHWVPLCEETFKRICTLRKAK